MACICRNGRIIHIYKHDWERDEWRRLFHPICIILWYLVFLVSVGSTFVVFFMTRQNSRLYEVKKVGYDAPIVTQVLQDWQNQPFVELTVEDEQCPPDSEPVFSWTWSGTKEGCWRRDNDRDPNHNSDIPFGQGSVVPAELSPGCPDDFTVWAVPGFEMTRFSRLGNKIICGQRAGSSYLDADMPDIISGSCPQGTFPCSNATSPGNTICYPQEQLESLCPINEIQIVDEVTAQSLASNSSYTIIDLSTNGTNNTYLAYSKIVKDSLPITTTMVGSQPCINPEMTSSNASYYELEIKRRTCNQDAVDKSYNRVVELGTEWSVQLEHGIVQKLSTLAYHERYVDYGQKTLETVSMWTRPSIPLQTKEGCPTKEQAIQTVKEYNANIGWSNGFLVQKRHGWLVTLPWWIVMIGNLLFSHVFGVTSFAKNQFPCGFVLIMLAHLLLWGGMTFSIFFQVMRIQPRLDRNLQSTESLAESFDGCLPYGMNIQDSQRDYDLTMKFLSIVQIFSTLAFVCALLQTGILAFKLIEMNYVVDIQQGSIDAQKKRDLEMKEKAAKEKQEIELANKTKQVQGLIHGGQA